MKSRNEADDGSTEAEPAANPGEPSEITVGVRCAVCGDLATYEPQTVEIDDGERVVCRTLCGNCHFGMFGGWWGPHPEYETHRGEEERS